MSIVFIIIINKEINRHIEIENKNKQTKKKSNVLHNAEKHFHILPFINHDVYSVGFCFVFNQWQMKVES